LRAEPALSARLGRARLNGSNFTCRSPYQVAKDPLWRRQHYKCCYCEHKCQQDYHDVEHYRPKTRADRGAAFPTHGYWWLAWTWANLLFACPGCNRSGKNDQFPLDGSSTALMAEQHPPGAEHPLLINPSAENPIPHIQYRPFLKNGKRQWTPMPRKGSLRGLQTITILRLDRPDLLDLYEDHVNQYVTPALNQVRTAITTGVPAAVRAEWQSHILPLLSRRRPHTALSYDVVDQEIPLRERRRWGLRLPRPR
jgi:uncharacterized protein (TIGR02646 family)